MDKDLHDLTVAIASAGLSLLAFSVILAPPSHNRTVPTSIEVVGNEALKIVNK